MVITYKAKTHASINCGVFGMKFSPYNFGLLLNFAVYNKQNKKKWLSLGASCLKIG